MEVLAVAAVAAAVPVLAGTVSALVNSKIHKLPDVSRSLSKIDERLSLIELHQRDIIRWQVDHMMFNHEEDR